MKTAAVFLREWVVNQVHFDGGGTGASRIWTREDLENMAGYLTGRITLNDTYVRLARRINWEMAERVRDGIAVFEMGAVVTARWLARMGSLKAVSETKVQLQIGDSGIGGKIGWVGVKGRQS